MDLAIFHQSVFGKNIFNFKWIGQFISYSNNVVKILFGWIFKYCISGFKLFTSHIDKY